VTGGWPNRSVTATSSWRIAATQDGLDVAGQRINQVRTEYAKVCPTTVLTRVGDVPSVQYVPDGQTSLFPAPMPGLASELQTVLAAATDAQRRPLELEFGFAGSVCGVPRTPEECEPSGRARYAVDTVARPHRYRLRDGVPRRFRTLVAMPDNTLTEEDCANRFLVSARELLDALKGRIGVQRRTLEVFTRQLELDLLGAELDPARLAKEAQRVLLESGVFDPRALREALERKVAAALREEAMDEAGDPEAVDRFLNTILARHPQLLYDAQRGRVGRHGRSARRGGTAVRTAHPTRPCHPPRATFMG
jgi:hypothetical protein